MPGHYDSPSGSVILDMGANSGESTPLILNQRPLAHTSDDGDVDGIENVAAAAAAATTGAGKKKSGGNLGTVLGVYIPVVSHLYGVLLFLRLGLVIGHAGTLLTLLMFGITYLTTVLTSLSISAIATNGKVQGGGAYFLISRSIGAEFGGSIGLIFYLSKVFSVTAGALGFTDALIDAFPSLPDSYWAKLLYTSIALILLAAICFVGSSLFAKTSFIFFVVLVACIGLVAASFAIQSPNPAIGFTSWSIDTFVENLFPSYGEDVTTGRMLSFSALLGIIYPACTAILGGVNMSGDLKKPHVAIPNGTLGAIITSAATYVPLILLIAFTTTKQILKTDLAIMSQVSFLPLMVNIGIMSTGLSSALGGIITSSKILQAIANDHLLPGIRIFKSQGEARRAYLITYILVQLTCLVGELNIIAPLITMFYLLCFAIINFACFALAITGAPNFRPLFKYFTWHTAAAGAITCLATMFVINPLYASVSIVILLIMLVVIHLFAPAHKWGDISQALMYHQVRKYLLRLDNRKTSHVKFWRPQVLLFVNNPRSSLPLISFINYLKKGGLYVIGHVVKHSEAEMDSDSIHQTNVGDGSSDTLIHRSSHRNIHRLSLEAVGLMNSTEIAWQALITEQGFKAFPSVVMSNSFHSGAQNLISSAGMGNVKSNTIVMGFFDPFKSSAAMLASTERSKAIQLFPQLSPEYNVSLDEYLALINDCCLLGKNVIIARHFAQLDMDQLAPASIVAKLTLQKHKYIDVWLPRIGPYRASTTQATESLLLQFGFILNKCPGAFSKFHRLRVVSIVDQFAHREQERQHLRELLYESRITNAIIDVLDLESLDVSQASAFERMSNASSQQSPFDEDPDASSSSAEMRGDELLKLNQRINAVIQANIDRTSVLFMPLPDRKSVV